MQSAGQPSKRKKDVDTLTMEQEYLKKGFTLRLPPIVYIDFKKTFEEHEKKLKVMGIDSLPAFFRWCANEGKPLVIDQLEKIEK